MARMMQTEYGNIMKFEIEIEEQFFENQILSAKIRYWCNDTIGFVPNFEGKFNLHAMEVQDAETMEWFRLDWKKAVQVAIAKYPRLFDTTRLDAISGDCWIQLAGFGDLRYG